MEQTDGFVPVQSSLLSRDYWLSLSQEVRAKIAEVFAFPPKGNVEVQYGAGNPHVLSDGYGYDAFRLVTVEKLQALLQTTDHDFYFLLNELVSLIQSGQLVPAEPEKVIETLPESDDSPKKKRHAKKGEEA